MMKLHPTLIVCLLFLSFVNPSVSENDGSADFGIFSATADWGLPEYPPQLGMYKRPGRVEITTKDDDFVYDVYGNGDQIFVDSDEGFFLYTPLIGSWTLTAQVEYIKKGGNSQWPVAGIMIREYGAATDSKLFSILCQAGRTTSFGDSIGIPWRLRTGEKAFGYELLTGEPIRLSHSGKPVFLRISRDAEENYFWAEWSYNGKLWQFGHGVHIEMAEEVAFGFDVANGLDNNELACIRYSKVTLTPAISYAKRHIPLGGYSPKIYIPIVLEVHNPTDQEQSITILEFPPEEWSVSHISHNGKLNGSSVIWKCSIPPGFTAFRYQVRPHPGDSETKHFSGIINTSPIQGDTTFIPSFLSIPNLINRTSIQQIVLILCCTMIFLHISIFIIYPHLRENLYFACFLLLIMITNYAQTQINEAESYTGVHFFSNMHEVGFVIAMLLLLLFFYQIVYGKPHPFFWIYFPIAVILVVMLQFLEFHLTPLMNFFILSIVIECLRVLIVGIMKKTRGIHFIAIGAIATLFLFIWALLYFLLFIPWLPTDFNTFRSIALLPLILSMTVNITYRFATINKELNESYTQQAEYQKKLRAMAVDLSLTEERERRQLASDLHDGISQSLALSIMELTMLKQKQDEKHETKFITQIVDRLNRTLKTTQTMTFELCPSSLYQLGLVESIEELADEIGSKYGLDIQIVKNHQKIPLSQDNQYFLYRAIQELLFNIIKHANATLVRIEFALDHQFSRICVSDDGQGFESSNPYNHSKQLGGYGLFSIQERLEQIGGHFDLHSQRERGTAVILLTPLERKKVTIS